MTRRATRCFGVAAVLSTVVLSAAAFAGDRSPDEMFKQMDADGDGRISAAEHAAGASKMFAKMDSNHDGGVTAAEMEAGHKMMMKDHSKADGMKHQDMKHSDMKHDGMKPADPMPKDLPEDTDGGN